MPTNAAPTLADVAAHAGVSLATASRALHPSNRVVRADLKARVLASAKQLGYSVNAQAQAVARGSGNSVALVVGDIADPYFAGIAAGAIRVATAAGLVVTITTLPYAEGESRVAREVEALNAVRAQRPRAVLFAASREVGSDWDAFAHLGGLVVIGSHVDGIRSVSIDNRAGAAALAEALAGLGYRDFAIVSGPSALSTVRERVEGFQSVVSADVHSDAFSRDGGYAAMSRLLAAGRRPECVFGVTDVMAIGAMAAISDAGLRPGVDVAVAGFDDIPLLRDVTPKLTSVALPLEEIGSRALELALAGDAEADTDADTDTDTDTDTDAHAHARTVTIRGAVRLRESTPGR